MQERHVELETHLADLLSRCGHLVVLDCSGHAKQKIADHWHILGSSQTWAQYLSCRVSQQQRLHWIGNPGCMASAVIDAVRASGLCFSGDIAVTAVGGQSFAPPQPQPPTQHQHQQQLRTSRHWRSHHHVREIDAALLSAGLRVSSFVPLVCSGLEHGLLVTVSGRARAAPAPAPGASDDSGAEGAGVEPGHVFSPTRRSALEALDVCEVLGTPCLVLRVDADRRERGPGPLPDSDPDRDPDAVFDATIAAAIDNVHRVAWLAVVAARQVVGGLSPPLPLPPSSS